MTRKPDVGVKGVARRRRVSNLLGLAVLATVIERPMHPYEMASIIRARGKDQDMRVKWGSLYTVVQNLEKHGLIEVSESVRHGGRPERTVYRITDAGREELADWVRELVQTPETESSRFEAALSVLAVLTPDEAIDLLGKRVAALEGQIVAQRATLAESDVPRGFLVEVEFAVAMREAEAAWVRSLVAELRSGDFPGLDLWREYHRTGAVPPEWQELAERGSVTD